MFISWVNFLRFLLVCVIWMCLVIYVTTFTEGKKKYRLKVRFPLCCICRQRDFDAWAGTRWVSTIRCGWCRTARCCRLWFIIRGWWRRCVLVLTRLRTRCRCSRSGCAQLLKCGAWKLCVQRNTHVAIVSRIQPLLPSMTKSYLFVLGVYFNKFRVDTTFHEKVDAVAHGLDARKVKQHCAWDPTLNVHALSKKDVTDKIVCWKVMLNLWAQSEWCWEIHDLEDVDWVCDVWTWVLVDVCAEKGKVYWRGSGWFVWLVFFDVPTDAQSGREGKGILIMNF